MDKKSQTAKLNAELGLRVKTLRESMGLSRKECAGIVCACCFLTKPVNKRRGAPQLAALLFYAS